MEAPKVHEIQFPEVTSPNNLIVSEKQAASTQTFDEGLSMKQILSSYPGTNNITAEEFNRFLIRKDLNHLLLSDVQAITKSLETDFPEVIKVYSIGQTYQERPINVIELDAKKWLESQMVKEPEPKKLSQKEHKHHKKNKSKKHKKDN